MIVKIEVEYCLAINFDYWIQIHLNGKLSLKWCTINKDFAFNKYIDKFDIPLVGEQVFYFHVLESDPFYKEIEELHRQWPSRVIN